MIEIYNFKDHMALFPLLSHAYSLKQSWQIPPYVRAVMFLTAIQHTETPSLIL